MKRLLRAILLLWLTACGAALAQEQVYIAEDCFRTRGIKIQGGAVFLLSFGGKTVAFQG